MLPKSPPSGPPPFELMNFRSLPAYTSRDGNRLRPEHLYRAGAPGSLRDIAHLDLGLAGDLRHPDERGSASDDTGPLWPFRLIALARSASSGEAPHLSLLNGSHLDEAAVERYYLTLYRSLPLTPFYRDLFGQFLRAVATDSGKILIFCAAGKDRTGILTAMIGRILNLREEDIAADYLLSNEDRSLQILVPIVLENARQSSGQILSDGLVQKILGVSTAYLDAAFDEIDAQFGSFDRYLDAIDVTATCRAEIRRRLLR